VGAAEDSQTFFFDNAESYGKRVDDLLTFFLAVKKDKLVGCQVKGLRKHLKRLGNFGIAIKHGNGRLDLFFQELRSFRPQVHTLAAFSPDLRLAALSDYEDVDLWDLRSGKLSKTLFDHRGSVERVQFSGDGHLLAVASMWSDGEKYFARSSCGAFPQVGNC
jgi:hypothetical protein